MKPIRAQDYTTIEKLKEVETPGKLANDLNGQKKKNKLDLRELSPEVVAQWIKKQFDQVAFDIEPQSSDWGFFFTIYHV